MFEINIWIYSNEFSEKTNFAFSGFSYYWPKLALNYHHKLDIIIVHEFI